MRKTLQWITLLSIVSAALGCASSQTSPVDVSMQPVASTTAAPSANTSRRDAPASSVSSADDAAAVIAARQGYEGRVLGQAAPADVPASTSSPAAMPAGPLTATPAPPAGSGTIVVAASADAATMAVAQNALANSRTTAPTGVVTPLPAGSGAASAPRLSTNTGTPVREPVAPTRTQSAGAVPTARPDPAAAPRLATNTSTPVLPETPSPAAAAAPSAAVAPVAEVVSAPPARAATSGSQPVRIEQTQAGVTVTNTPAPRDSRLRRALRAIGIGRRTPPAAPPVQ